MDESAVFLTKESSSLQSKRNRKFFLIIFLLVFIISSIWFVNKYFPERLNALIKEVGLETIFFKTKTKPVTEAKIIQKVDKKAGTGEFFFEYPIQGAITPNPQRQVLVEGFYWPRSGRIDIKVYDQLSVQQLDSALVRTSDPWVLVEMVIEGQVVYKTLSPLFISEGEEAIPFGVNLPYEKNFLLKIYNKQQKLLLSKEVSL